jgi:hypothetical protein
LSPDDLLKRSGEIRQYDAPSKTDREAVAGLIWNEGELSGADRSYIEHVDDLMAICSDTESSWIHGLLLALSLKITVGKTFVRVSTEKRRRHKPHVHCPLSSSKLS